MAYLDIDFTIPMVLLASAIAGVLLVRQLSLWGERRARARTHRLIATHASSSAATGKAETGRQEKKSGAS